MPHYVASNQGLHFLPNTSLGVSSMKKVIKHYFLYLCFYRLLTVGGVLVVIAALVVDIWDDFERFKPAGGLAILLILAVVFSKAPRKVYFKAL